MKGGIAADERTDGHKVRCDGGGRRDEGASVHTATAAPVAPAATLRLASTGTVNIRRQILNVCVESVLSLACYKDSDDTLIVKSADEASVTPVSDSP